MSSYSSVNSSSYLLRTGRGSLWSFLVSVGAFGYKMSLEVSPTCGLPLSTRFRLSYDTHSNLAGLSSQERLMEEDPTIWDAYKDYKRWQSAVQDYTLYMNSGERPCELMEYGTMKTTMERRTRRGNRKVSLDHELLIHGEEMFHRPPTRPGESRRLYFLLLPPYRPSRGTGV
ncbi:hypothetical protein F5880DRAFT_194973 [Lentinula raphanica]|nr:hypothetical protein F5880DRAFT_194973 [Lentinula raphanica]